MRLWRCRPWLGMCDSAGDGSREGRGDGGEMVPNGLG